MQDSIMRLSDATEGYGGKAAGLAKLFSHQLPVPNGVALSPAFVEELVSDPKNERHLALISKIVSGSDTKWAVRSSALNEDGKDSSFAGIYDTVLNVSNDPVEIINAVIVVAKGQTSARVSLYKADRQQREPIGDKQPQLGIVVQEMVPVKIAGVAFTSALSVVGKESMLIEYVEGLGDKLVSGEVTPTRIEVPLTAGVPDINSCRVSGAPIELNGFSKLVKLLENVVRSSQDKLDIEWAIDVQGNPWLLQARPITKPVLVPAIANVHSVPAAPGVAKAVTFVVDTEEDMTSFPDGAVLVAQVTETSHLPVMRRASAIITEEGGMLSHAAIVSREIGVPCIVGYTKAREYFPTGTMVTVNGTSGVVSNNSDPDRVASNIKKQDIDWGSAYLFDGITAVTLSGVTGLYDPTLTGLALHIPDDIAANVDEEFEVFSRKNFGQSPKCYQSDKYLWYFELQRFRELDFFEENLKKSIKVTNEMNADLINNHYEEVIDKARRLVEFRSECKDDASCFVIDESLLSSHFLLTMLIPEGYALKEMYAKAAPLLVSKASFSDVLSGKKNVIGQDSNLKKIFEFSEAVSQLRNTVYDRLVAAGIMRDDYFDDREVRAAKALAAIGVDCPSEQDPIYVFYQNK